MDDHYWRGTKKRYAVEFIGQYEIYNIPIVDKGGGDQGGDLMALRKCPQCKQSVSDITGRCPVCDYSFVVTQLDFSKKASVQKEPKEKRIVWSKLGKHPVLMILATVLFFYSLVYLFKGKFLFWLAISIFSLFLWGIGAYGVSTTQAPRKRCCARCGSENLTFSVLYGQQILGYTSEVRKKSIAARAANDIGRTGLILATGGLWALTPKRSKYQEVATFRTREIKHKTAVCQDCGFSWEMLW